jgi:predicted nucleic acid-binding protein
MTQGQPPEVILCDTTFVSLQEASERKPEAIAHWPREVLTRIDGAIQAVSVFTLAEIRAGRIAANWGQRRSERQERLLAAFVTIPLDEDILSEYATMHAWSVRGHHTPHNDLWIAATAIARGFPLVSCDAHFERIAEAHELEHIFLPRNPPM